MKESQSTDSTAELIRSLPTLPSSAYWFSGRRTSVNQPARIQAEVMIPVLAFRLQEKAYGGLDAGVRGRLREITDSLTPKNRVHTEARDLVNPPPRRRELCPESDFQRRESPAQISL